MERWNQHMYNFLLALRITHRENEHDTDCNTHPAASGQSGVSCDGAVVSASACPRAARGGSICQRPRAAVDATACSRGGKGKQTDAWAL